MQTQDPITRFVNLLKTPAKEETEWPKIAEILELASKKDFDFDKQFSKIENRNLFDTLDTAMKYHEKEALFQEKFSKFFKKHSKMIGRMLPWALQEAIIHLNSTAISILLDRNTTVDLIFFRDQLNHFCKSNLEESFIKNTIDSVSKKNSKIQLTSDVVKIINDFLLNKKMFHPSGGFSFAEDDAKLDHPLYIKAVLSKIDNHSNLEKILKDLKGKLKNEKELIGGENYCEKWIIDRIPDISILVSHANAQKNSVMWSMDLGSLKDLIRSKNPLTDYKEVVQLLIFLSKRGADTQFMNYVLTKKYEPKMLDRLMNFGKKSNFFKMIYNELKLIPQKESGFKPFENALIASAFEANNYLAKEKNRKNFSTRLSSTFKAVMGVIGQIMRKTPGHPSDKSSSDSQSSFSFDKEKAVQTIPKPIASPDITSSQPYVTSLVKSSNLAETFKTIRDEVRPLKNGK